MPSATLLAAQQVEERLRAGLSVYNFGLGACPMPAPDALVDKLKEFSHLKEYTSGHGIPSLNKQLLKSYPHGSHVLVGNGSKPLLFILFMSWPGRVVVPVPAWVSYIEQLKLLKKTCLFIESDITSQFKVTPELVREYCRSGDLLVITNPNNPTGAAYTAAELEYIVDACRSVGVSIHADEIYLQLAYKEDNRTSIATLYPEATIVTSGLSKEFGCGGWRCGWIILPDTFTELFNRMSGIASTLYSCASHPLQEVAAYALSYPKEIVKHVSNSRRIFEKGAVLVQRLLSNAGIQCTTPMAAWYVWACFDDYADVLKLNGIESSEQLARQLMQDIGFVAIPGSAFGKSGLCLRLSVVDINPSDSAHERWDHVLEGIDLLIKYIKCTPV